MDTTLHLLRFAAMLVAGWLIARGWIGESDREALVGLLTAAGAYAWSYAARRQAKAEIPPEILGRLAQAEEALAAMRLDGPPR